MATQNGPIQNEEINNLTISIDKADDNYNDIEIGGKMKIQNGGEKNGNCVTTDVKEIGGENRITDFQNGVDKTNGVAMVTSVKENGDVNEKSGKENGGMGLLGLPRTGHRMSFMEVESAREKTRLTLLKQCSAILKQGDQRYTKESLHKTFQDEDLVERFFRLFDANKEDHLIQNDWIEYLKERLPEDKQLDFVEQVECVAYILCGHGVVTLDIFHSIFQNKIVTNKLFRVVDTDCDGHVTADEVMEFLSTITSTRPRVGFDRHSVDRLEQLFRETVGDQKEITREQFQKIVVSKNEFFTERVFQIFDEDDSGAISLQEFIAAVHRFAGHTPDDKIRFLFKIYDIDGDGLIQRRELQHVMSACMVENGMIFSDSQLLELTAAMFEDADVEGRGAITYEALRDQLNKHPGLTENLSISIDRWLVPNKPEPKPISFKQKLKNLKPHQLSMAYLKNNHVFVGYLVLYCLVNVVLFVSRCIEYRHSNGFVIVARGCGQCLNFNCAWILVLMLRASLTFLRVRRFGAFLPLDHHIYLHKLCGVLVCLFALLHTAMHLCNFSLIVVNDPIANAGNFTTSEWILTSRPGVLGLVPGCANPTGIAIVLVLIVMAVCSQPFVRRTGCFEIFYWTHLLYVPFWILLVFHAPNFWKWFILPGTVYLIERILRLAWMRSERGKTYISSGILLPSRVTHLVVKRPPQFSFHAGDYVFVNIPAIATYEWHPFTISSAPDQQEHIWLHVRGVGEWTNRVHEYFRAQHAARTHTRDLARTTSNQSNRSILSTPEKEGNKKRSVDFSPIAYTNEGYVNDEKSKSDFKVESPLRLAVLAPRALEKSCSMPDVHNNVKKKQRLIALRDYTRSESESNFDTCEARRSHGKVYRSPHHRALAHSFRYMRNKPTIIAFKTPSMEDCERRDSILTLARRRLSKSLSPDKDAECPDKPSIHVISPSTGSEASDESSFLNYPVGKPLEIYLDGPYGAASSHIFLSQHAALIAAGIGVTPFASLLQSIMARHWDSVCSSCERCSAATRSSLTKVDFFWINREQRSFEWFVSLLSQLEIEQAERTKPGTDRFLEMHMYITSALQKTDMKAVGLQLALDLLHEKEKRDLITGLKTRTNAGRPNWDKVFNQLKQQNKGKVTVFYCGPPQLARILRVKCDQFGFGFRKEVF